MNREDMNRFKAELDRFEAEMKRNHEKYIAAIAQLRSMSEQGRQAPQPTVRQPLLEATLTRRGIYETIEDIIVARGDAEFEVQDIWTELRERKGQRCSWRHRRIISQIINKLRHRDPSEVEVLQAGKGRTSGLYQYVGGQHRLAPAAIQFQPQPPPTPPLLDGQQEPSSNPQP